jgi:hypothetical protein
MSNTADFVLQNHGSVCLLCPMTEAASDHLEASTSEEAFWFAGGLVVEPRYVGDIVAALSDEGFTVSPAS